MKKLVKITAVLMLSVLLALTCVSCAPANTEKAEAKMEKAGYTVVVTVNKEVGENGEVATLLATKKTEGNLLSQIGAALDDNLTAVLYDSLKNAKAAYDKTADAEGNSNYTRVGKWVVVGSEEAVKAFKAFGF